MRFVVGLLKGGLLGGALGAGLWALFPAGAPAFLEYLLYGLVGAAAGAICGTPPWRRGAWIGAVLKGVVGVGVGIGIYVLVRSYVNVPIPLTMFAPDQRLLSHEYFVLAPIVGIAYGLLIELDDGGSRAAEQYAKPTARKKDVEDIKVD
ncbi:MAG: hypothetical protein HYY06_22090 [Deltaproteobacteria bacterium]|nr:hypothetical protein [Deltaproteobacteria bacterium]